MVKPGEGEGAVWRMHPLMRSHGFGRSADAFHVAKT